jgi:hypothetical protein
MNQGTKNDIIGVIFFLFVCAFSLLHAWLSNDCPQCPECPEAAQCLPVSPADTDTDEPEEAIYDV